MSAHTGQSKIGFVPARRRVLARVGISVLKVVLVVLIVVIVATMAKFWKPPLLAFESTPLNPPTFESTLDLPIAMPLEQLRSSLEASVPPQFQDVKSANVGGNLHKESIRYTLNRGAIAVSGVEGALRLSTVVSGSARFSAELCLGGRGLPCSDVRKDVQLRAQVHGDLGNLRLNPDWTIGVDFNPSVHFDVAKVELFDLIPVSFRSEINKAVNSALPKVKAGIDQQLSGESIRLQVSDAWEKFDHVVQVYSDPATWMVIEPLGVGLAPVLVDDSSIVSALRLAMRVRTVVGEKPSDPKPPMPGVLRPDQLVPEGFVLQLPVFVSMAELRRQLRACCIPFELEGGAGLKLKVTDVALAEDKGSLVLATDWSEGLFRSRGRVYLRGTPVIGEDNTLRLHDLDVDLRTDQHALEGAVEVLKPFILAELSERIVLDLQPQYERMLALANAQSEFVVGEGMRLSSSLRSFELTRVMVGGGQLVLVAEARGVANVLGK